jgi:hypothetical protein
MTVQLILSHTKVHGFSTDVNDRFVHPWMTAWWPAPAIGVARLAPQTAASNRLAKMA